VDSAFLELVSNTPAQGPYDVPMGSNEGDQVQGQSNPKEVQEAIQVVRKFIEDQGYYPAVPVSACNNLVTKIT